MRVWWYRGLENEEAVFECVDDMSKSRYRLMIVSKAISIVPGCRGFKFMGR